MATSEDVVLLYTQGDTWSVESGGWSGLTLARYHKSYQGFTEKDRMAAKDHRELRVYQIAFELAIRIHDLSKGFPAEERYSLTDQIRRSSRAVCANIAEAWRKWRYSKSFVGKLSDADSEAAETLVWLDFAFHLGYISANVNEELSDRYVHTGSQLTLMMSEPHQWVPKSAASATLK